MPGPPRCTPSARSLHVGKSGTGHLSPGPIHGQQHHPTLGDSKGKMKGIRKARLGARELCVVEGKAAHAQSGAKHEGTVDKAHRARVGRRRRLRVVVAEMVAIGVPGGGPYPVADRTRVRAGWWWRVGAASTSAGGGGAGGAGGAGSAAAVGGASDTWACCARSHSVNAKAGRASRSRRRRLASTSDSGRWVP